MDPDFFRVGSGYSGDPDPDSGKKVSPDPEKNPDPKHLINDLDRYTKWSCLSLQLTYALKQPPSTAVKVGRSSLCTLL